MSTEEQELDDAFAGPTLQAPAQAPSAETDSNELIDAKLEGMRARQRAVDLDAKRRKSAVFADLFGRPLEAVKIGRLTVVRKLGEGGMGVVYLAYDEQLDRRVAVKLLHASASEPETKARFEREAQAMARLQHPNVVTVHEVGTHDEQVYVAMEFVEGRDLRGWMARGPWHWREVVAMFRQAGEGLAAAHDAGIVHRDFKPDNVLVGKDGRARVADFGLAHGFGEPIELGPRAPEDSASSRLNVELTRPGAVMGTPAYMPPEQYAGERSDARGDQFSFCVTLWEALYGERPFRGKNLVDLAHAITEGKIQQPEGEQHVPVWLRAIVLRGLEADPAKRWPSMRALLDAIGDDPSIARRRLLARLGVGIGVLALLGVGWVASREIGHNLRQRYWNAVTEELLELERERGLRQAQADASAARDATRLSVAGTYKLQTDKVEREDPTVAAALLREVEGEAARGGGWASMANELLGQPLSKAVLEGHRGAITALHYGPEGRWLYSAADDGEVWRWDMHAFAGERIDAHAVAVVSLALDLQGRHLATGSQDGKLRLWNAESGASEELLGCEGAVSISGFSAAGQLLAGCVGGQLELLAPSGERVSSFRAGEGLRAAALDPEGRWLLSAGDEGTPRVWSLEHPEQPPRTLEGHTRPVFFARFVGPGRALTAADDGRALLWQLDQPELPPQAIVDHQKPISAIALRGDQLASASTDGRMLLSSLSGARDPVELGAHEGLVWSLAFAKQGVVSASYDKTARLSDLSGKVAPTVMRGHRSSLEVAALDPSGRWLATGSYDTDVRIWELARPVLRTPLRGHRAAVSNAEVDATGERALTASHDGTLHLWNLGRGSLIASSDRGGLINRATFSPDGSLIAAARNNRRVTLWNPATGEQRVLGEHQKRVHAVAFSPDGTLVASASEDQTLGLWPLDPERPSTLLRGHESRVWDLAFDRSGEHLVSASWDGTLKVWAVESGELLATLEGHEGRVRRVVLSPSGSQWASASDDGSVRLWPADFEGESLRLAGHDKGVSSLAYDELGERLVSVAHDGSALVWGSADGELLARLDGHGSPVWDAAFLPDGRVVTAAGDGAVRVWPMVKGEPPIVLPAHRADVSSLALGQGLRMVSTGQDGSALMWRLELVEHDVEILGDALRLVTSLCPSAELRELELGESREQALAGEQACLAQ